MIYILELIVQYYVQINIQIVKLVIEIIHVLVALIEYFLEEIVMNHVLIVLEIQVIVI